MATQNPFDRVKRFDMSKLPSELRAVPEEQFLLLMRAVFAHALALSYGTYDVALDVTYEALHRLTTDKRWNPEEGPLREHFLELVAPCYRELRFGRPEEKAACRFYAHEQGDLSGSAEDFAVYVEEQPDLERDDENRTRLAAEVLASIARDDVAMGVARVWQEHGWTKPRETAALLGVDVREVYRATRLIRYQADKAKKVLRRKANGGVS